MKKLLTFLLLLITFSVYSQIDYNIYIGNTKKEILKILKEDGFKYSLQQKLYVNIDSTGKWTLSDNYYTYLLYYSNHSSNTRALFTFDKNDHCVKYYLLCENLENYWNYYDYYNKILDFNKESTNDEIEWIEKRHKYYVQIRLKALNGRQFQIFVNSKSYKTYKNK